MSAAARRRRTQPKKKPLNPFLIAGPIVGIFVILLLFAVFKGGEDKPAPPPAKTAAEIAAEKARAEAAREKKLAEEKELRQAKLLMDLNKRAASCKTADELVALAREARRNGLDTAADGFYAKALTLDPDNTGAHRGLSHVKFECSRYLEDFDSLDFSGLHDELAPYKALEGKWLPPPRFEEVKAKWKKDLPRFNQLVEQRENDPYELKVSSYAKRLKNKPFFNDIARTNGYTICRDPKPVALFIQEALDRQEGHAGEIARKYTPPLKALDKFMTEHFFKKFGFKRRDGFDAYIVWVLNSHGSYDNFFRIGKRQFGLSDSQWAHYNFMNRVAITFIETRPGMDDMVMHALLHEMVHYYQDSYAPYGIRGMSSFWVIEGMAEWVSTFSGKLPGGPFYFMSKNSGRIREFLYMIEKLDGEWPIPMIALLDIPNGVQLSSAIDAAIADEPKIADMGSKADIHSMLTSWTYGFGYCLCRYLYAEKEEAFMRYLKLDFNGDGGTEAFQETLGIKNLTAFQKTLVDYFKKK